MTDSVLQAAGPIALPDAFTPLADAAAMFTTPEEYIYSRKISVSASVNTPGVLIPPPRRIRFLTLCSHGTPHSWDGHGRLSTWICHWARPRPHAVRRLCRGQACLPCPLRGLRVTPQFPSAGAVQHRRGMRRFRRVTTTRPPGPLGHPEARLLPSGDCVGDRVHHNPTSACKKQRWNRSSPRSIQRPLQALTLKKKHPQSNMSCSAGPPVSVGWVWTGGGPGFCFCVLPDRRLPKAVRSAVQTLKAKFESQSLGRTLNEPLFIQRAHTCSSCVGTRLCLIGKQFLCETLGKKELESLKSPFRLLGSPGCWVQHVLARQRAGGRDPTGWRPPAERPALMSVEVWCTGSQAVLGLIRILLYMTQEETVAKPLRGMNQKLAE
ncbi:uncharacterized protein LOC123620528 [Lemur catta]|uniref:uncharacterized protein LOC123620528 n=1 Tax=Lemur catta TaxID=9447 RepID=UPI001E267A77|nr:uncharacterized protein LOC123620528 [Lemur catta]